jgi:hypothetical protein
MRTPSVNNGLSIRRAIVPATLVALLAGCAMAPAPRSASSASACGSSAVLYCETSPHGKTCECARHSDLRDLMGTLSLR